MQWAFHRRYAYPPRPLLVGSSTIASICLRISAASAALVYLSSLLYAWTGASAEFVYPTYLELALCASGYYMYQRQTDDTHTSVDPSILSQLNTGVSSFSIPSMAIDVIYEGRSIWLFFGFDGSGLFFEAGFFTRQIKLEHILFGLGINMLMSMDVVNGASIRELNPLPPEFLYSPCLSFSYKSTVFELDILASPYALVSGRSFDLSEGPNVKNDFTQYSTAMFGFRGQALMNYFFSLRAGIHLVLDGYYLINPDSPVEEAGFSAIDKIQFLRAKLGIVYRL